MSIIESKREVRAAFSNFVMVNQTLVKHFGDANPALFLGYLISEDKYHEENQKLDQFGYFYCTSKKIEDKFGLSHKVQDTIICKLTNDDLIDIIVKPVDGSSNISPKKHFKVLHENIYNLVKKIKCQESGGASTLPDYLVKIQDALISFAEKCGAKYNSTGADEKILKIARLHGLQPEIINQSIAERYSDIEGKSVTAKYLLKAFIPKIDDFEAMPDLRSVTNLALKVG